MKPADLATAPDHAVRDRGGPQQPLFIATGLNKRFALRGTSKKVHAVKDVSFTVMKGETLGVVGESGCGKSTLGRLLLRFVMPDSGELIFDGDGVGHEISVDELRRQVQMVVQDSGGSLNPRLSILDSVAFGPIAQGRSRSEARAQAAQVLQQVGLEPGRFGTRFPHELSGGQKQRANIARSLALQPRMLILDESVSALDKTIAAKVINLLQQLKRDLGLTYMFISHDLDVVHFVSDRVLVMYLGRVVEFGDAADIFESPQHPYTRALLAARPSVDPRRRTTVVPLDGEPPDPIDPPSGCAFHVRCPFAEPVCRIKVPALSNHQRPVACWMYEPSGGHSRSMALAARETGAIV